MALACVVIVARASGAAPDALSEHRVRLAIVAAVEGRLGNGITVRVTALQVNGTLPAGALVAAPETSARSGRSAVFALSAAGQGGRRRIGSAVATVLVEGPCVRAARALARGEVIGADDVLERTGPLDDVPLRALPERASLLGAKLARDVAAGDVLTDIVVRPVPLVQSGDEVTIRARVDGVEAQGRAIAAQSGGAGALIQVVNPETRRMLKGRVVGRSEVEVIHETN